MSDIVELLRMRALHDYDGGNFHLVPHKAMMSAAADEIERLTALVSTMANDLTKAGGRELDKLAEIERLRAALLKAYQFISPLSDPIPMTNSAMAAEIRAVLNTGNQQT